MRTLTLGIALSTLVGSLALAQNSSQNSGQDSSKAGNGSKQSIATPSGNGTTSTQVSTNTTANSAKTSGRTIAQTVASNENLDTLESLLGQAGLNGTFTGNSSFTVFAPTDAAFELLGEETLTNLAKPENKAKLTAILTYHVVPGAMGSSSFTANGNANTLNGQKLGFAGTNGKFTVQEVMITQTDIQCSNGMIHVIDAVLVPTESNLVEIAGTNSNYRTFLKACAAAGLDATLAKSGNYTVFAPTDEAFAKLPAGMLEMLMQPENRKQLRDILSYHVVPGNRFLSNDLNGRRELTTASGQMLNVFTDGGSVTLANGTVVTSDLQATNGVIHGVDTVLLPGVTANNVTAKGKGKPANSTTATGQEKESN